MNQTAASIVRIRNAIRLHRDQKGDDRCWIDDYDVWSLMADSPQDLTVLPSFEEGMKVCREFFEHRRAQIADVPSPNAIVDRTQWDADLESMTSEQLAETLGLLETAVRTHRDIRDRHRTIDDDRALYEILPEKMPADFRLPEEDAFLGEKKKPHAGCPSFWRSHQACPCATHDLHRWGPCC